MKEGKNAGCGLVIGVLSGEHNTAQLQKHGANIIINNIMELDKEQLTCDFFYKFINILLYIIINNLY